jgi:hypothetical protein
MYIFNAATAYDVFSSLGKSFLKNKYKNSNYKSVEV